MDSCHAVENEFDKAVKKLSINTVGIEKVVSKLTAFKDELKNSEFILLIRLICRVMSVWCHTYVLKHKW